MAGADLREACLDEALRIIRERGTEGLSLREVARRLGVSHQAPYRHFASKEHVLAALIGRAFSRFADHLEAVPETGDALARLAAMGEAYLAHARLAPLEYRLMFETHLPEAHLHPLPQAEGRRAFDALRRAIHAVHRSLGVPPGAEDADALFVWATVHGLTSILGHGSLAPLALAPAAESGLVRNTLEAIARSLVRGRG